MHVQACVLASVEFFSFLWLDEHQAFAELFAYVCVCVCLQWCVGVFGMCICKVRYSHCPPPATPAGGAGPVGMGTGIGSAPGAG